MKKLTSVVLSVLMVVSMLSCLFVGSASAEETGSTAPNLITNGDFESFDVNTRKPDNNENHNCVPAFAWRSIKTILGNDKTNGQWYRTTDGCKPNESPDLDSNYNDVTKSKTTYPTYFGANSQMVIEPTEAGNSTNHVLRAVQDLNAQVELENKGKYTLSFRFKLPNANTGLTSFTLSFITPDVDPNNPSAAFHKVKKPYVITNAKLESSGTDDGITIDSNNNIIQFAGSNAHEDWKNVKVTFEVNRDNTVDFPVYTDSADNNKEYTFPVLMRIQFSLGDKIDLSTQLGENSSIQKKDSFLKTCIYFDDFAMYEVVDCFGDADFYDVDGNPPTQKNAYVGIKTQVNGIETSALKLGDVVTATLEYNKDCNIFAGWYKNDGEFVQKAETLTFTVNDTDKYYPKFIDINLLRGAASFEGYDNGTTLTYADSDADTSGNFPAPTSDKWGTSYQGAYFTNKNNHFKLSIVKGSKDEPYYSPEDKSQTNYSKKMTVIPHSGDSMLRINTHSRSAICALEKLTPNTDYTLSFYVYDTSDQDYISSVGIADRYIGYNPNGATSTTPGNIANISRDYAEGWQKVEISFNSGENATLYLFIAQSASAQLANQGASFVDDLVCYKDNLTGDDLGNTDITKHKAFNMRSAYGENVKQALRYKFTIKQELIDKGNTLYGDLVEYGSIAVPTQYLNGKELVKDGTYNSKSPAEGVAYQKDADGEVVINKIFAKEGTTITFTAALTGIGTNNYGRSYTVRNYLIFKDRDTGKETVVYGAKAEASVFDVMAAILTEYQHDSSKDQTKADFNTVKSILNKEGNEEIKNKFIQDYDDENSSYANLLNS